MSSLGKLLIWILSYIEYEQVPRRRGATGTEHSQAPFLFLPKLSARAADPPRSCFPFRLLGSLPKFPATATVTSPACPLPALCPTPLHQLPWLLTGSHTQCRVCGRLRDSEPTVPSRCGRSSGFMSGGHRSQG